MNTEEHPKKALLISISEYDHLNPLDFCKNDGNEMYKLLEILGYEIPDDRKLIGGRIEYLKLRDSIIDFFSDATISPKDTVLFYFSGHGVPGDDGEHYLSTSEIDPAIPYKRGFSFDEFTRAREGCNSKTVFTILDCCYSGAAKPSKGHEVDAAKIGKEIIINKSNTPGEGRCILAACKPMQEAYEFKEQGHSFFTYYLLEGLSGGGGKCVDNDGNVTPELLNQYVDNKIGNLPPEIRPKQRPYLSCEAAGKIVLAHHPQLAPKTKINPKKQYFYDLLLGGYIAQFNLVRENPLDLQEIDLHTKDLAGVNLHGGNLEGANLQGANLEKANFKGASLKDSFFEFADLRQANLEGANLQGANLEFADLRQANLEGANLQGANLEFADLRQAHVLNMDLNGTDLREADLRETVNLPIEKKEALSRGAFV
jgi:Caspase domain/Pentapeptide repeats (8 copies)